jgi:hypothetical protein
MIYCFLDSAFTSQGITQTDMSQCTFWVELKAFLERLNCIIELLQFHKEFGDVEIPLLELSELNYCFLQDIQSLCELANLFVSNR